MPRLPICKTKIIHGHAKAVVAVKHSPSGNLIASASADTKACILTSTGDLSCILEHEHTLGLNDCVWLDESYLITASDDKTVKLWNIEKQAAFGTLLGHDGPVYSLAENIYNRIIYSGGFDGSIILHDPCMQSVALNFLAHSDTISSLASSVNGYDLVSGSLDGIVRIWDSRHYAACKYAIKMPSSAPVSCVSYSENGHFLLVSTHDSTHRLYSVHGPPDEHGVIPSVIDFENTGSSVTTEPVLEHEYLGHRNVSYTVSSCLGSLPFGDFLISGSENGKVCMWDISDSHKFYAALDGHVGPVYSVSTCETSGQVVSAGKDLTIRLWDFEDSSEPREEEVGGRQDKEPYHTSDHISAEDDDDMQSISEEKDEIAAPIVSEASLGTSMSLDSAETTDNNPAVAPKESELSPQASHVPIESSMIE